jgi:hypothetical protein
MPFLKWKVCPPVTSEAGARRFFLMIYEFLINFQVPNARLCQIWCDQNPECHYFTWWSTGMLHNICFHHADCTLVDFDCVGCHAGPRTDSCTPTATVHRRIDKRRKRRQTPTNADKKNKSSLLLNED